MGLKFQENDVDQLVIFEQPNLVLLSKLANQSPEYALFTILAIYHLDF